MLYIFIQTVPSRPNTCLIKEILTLLAQFCPPQAGKGQITHSPGTEDSRFSHDVTTAMLVPLNKEKAAMLVPRPNPPGIQLYYYANVFFCFR